MISWADYAIVASLALFILGGSTEGGTYYRRWCIQSAVIFVPLNFTALALLFEVFSEPLSQPARASAAANRTEYVLSFIAAKNRAQVAARQHN